MILQTSEYVERLYETGLHYQSFIGFVVLPELFVFLLRLKPIYSTYAGEIKFLPREKWSEY